MGPLAVAALSLALMLGGASVGAWLRRSLPEHHLDGVSAHSIGAEIFRALHALDAPHPAQHSVREHAAALALDIARARLSLFEAMQTPLPLFVVAVLTFWLTALFVSFSLFTPVNRAARVALVVIALSASSVLFLFLEMRDPLAGIVHIPRSAIAGALPPLP